MIFYGNNCMHKTNIMAYNFHIGRYNLKYKTFIRDNQNIIQFIFIQLYPTITYMYWQHLTLDN